MYCKVHWASRSIDVLHYLLICFYVDQCQESVCLFVYIIYLPFFFPFFLLSFLSFPFFLSFSFFLSYLSHIFFFLYINIVNIYSLFLWYSYVLLTFMIDINIVNHNQLLWAYKNNSYDMSYSFFIHLPFFFFYFVNILFTIPFVISWYS